MTPHPSGQVRVIGGGPIGLLLTALLQSMDGPPVRLYDRRGGYTRTRMVSLAPYLVADSIESYGADTIDGDSVEAIFEPAELETRLAFRRTIAPDLSSLLREWTRGFVPLNTIERSLSDLIDAGAGGTVERIDGDVSSDEALSMAEPGDILVDCTGTRSLLRDHLVPGPEAERRGRNTLRFRLEYALVVTFLYDQPYACDEYCKYYKNIGNSDYKFIPAVHRTFYDGSTSHVTGIITIGREEFEAMPPAFDGAWLRDNFPQIAQSMDRFIDKIKEETHGELVGDLEIVRIPLDLYRARNATSRRWHGSGVDHALADDAGLPARRLGDGLAVLPGDLTRLRERLLPGRPHRQSGAVARDDVRPLRDVHVPAMAAGLHAQPDDQAQQGPARIGRRHHGPARAAARLLTSRSVSEDWLRR